LFDVWFDMTPGTFDTEYFKQMLLEVDSYPSGYDLPAPWSRNSELGVHFGGANGIVVDENRNTATAGHYSMPDFPRCGQDGGSLLGTANGQCMNGQNPNGTHIDSAKYGVPLFWCPLWTQTCAAGRWCRHLPPVNEANQANVKSLMNFTVFGGRGGRITTLASDWALLKRPDTLQAVRHFAASPPSFHGAFAAVMSKMADLGHQGLNTCTYTPCQVQGNTASCSGVRLQNCNWPATPQQCHLTGATGVRGTISCGDQTFECDFDSSTSDLWNSHF